MRTFIIRFIVTILLLVSAVIFIIFIQNVVDKGEAMRILDNRLIVAKEDYKSYGIDKYDLVIAHEITADKIKKGQIIAYYTSNEEYKFTKVLNIEGDKVEIETTKKDKTITTDAVKGLYFQDKVAKVGKYILYLQSLKGFLTSMGVVFGIIIVTSLFENISFAIQKMFTKKDRNTTTM